MNMFVAGFIGSPTMNMIEGEIASRNSVTDFHSNAGTVDLARYDFAGPPAAGAAVLGIRPEHIGIGAAPSGRHGNRGKVALVEPMGGETVVWTEFAGKPFVIKTDGERDFVLGEAIDFYFDVAH